MADVLFEPLRFRNLEVKNRDPPLEHLQAGSTTTTAPARNTRINWEVKFARGGVGAIVSSWCGVDPRGFIVPSYAAIDRDDTIPFWRELGKRVHEHDCKYILQLAYGGRQRDIQGIDVPEGALVDGQARSAARLPVRAGDAGAAAARSPRRSPTARAARARPGSTASRSTAPTATSSRSSCPPRSTTARTSTAARSRTAPASCWRSCARSATEVGNDFHLQVKLSATEYANAFLPWLEEGQHDRGLGAGARWIEEAGADAIHVSAGATFPHPDNPAGDIAAEDVCRPMT